MTAPHSNAKRINDYAVIGDGRSAALVSRGGDIDWLCWPRFESGAVFAALLDPSAGHWSIAPTGTSAVSRRYVPDTNVLETTFETSTGARVVLTDFMPALSPEQQRKALRPAHELLRIVRCEGGDAEIEHVFDPRAGFSRTPPRARDAGALGVRIETPDGLLVLRTDMPHARGHDLPRRARATLRAGEEWHFSLTMSDDWPAVLPPLGARTRDVLEASTEWWRRWASRLTYDGPARDLVVRSALALRLLVYAPSGAVAAAATTSLPERMGGDLNWDYRFCWPRDASLTVRALFGLGCRDEADAFVSWLLHATRLTRPELRVLYDVHGRVPRYERTLDDFEGFGGSRPVRLGNAASDQVQLDVYGEVIEATVRFAREGGVLDRETQRMLVQWGEWLCKHWREPDDGIWEPRSGKQHNTHSRLLAWTALDRLIALCEDHRLDIPKAKLIDNRDAIRREIEERAWNEERQSYVSKIGGKDLDATLLLLPWYGFEEPSSPRMKRTYEAVRRELGAGEGLLYRYRNEDSPGEGAFGICGFWAAEYLAMGGGTYEEALTLFEQLCSYANDVGLFAEEIDPGSREALGNFPQAFTHVGLINAALTLDARRRGKVSTGATMAGGGAARGA